MGNAYPPVGGWRIGPGGSKVAAMGARPWAAGPGALGLTNGGPWHRLQRPLPLAWPHSHLVAPWPGPLATWTGLCELLSHHHL